MRYLRHFFYGITDQARSLEPGQSESGDAQLGHLQLCEHDDPD
jgi:hypothetical protein